MPLPGEGLSKRLRWRGILKKAGFAVGLFTMVIIGLEYIRVVG